MKWFLEENTFYNEYQIYEKAIAFGKDIFSKYK